MKLCGDVACVIAIAWAGSTVLPAAQKEQAEDQKAILGVWRGGWPNEKTASYEIVITPEKISAKNLKTGENLGEGTYQLDPKNKTLDATRTVDPNKGRTFLGIYDISGDTLKWCSSNGTKKRPGELAFKPGDDHYLLVLKREK